MSWEKFQLIFSIFYDLLILLFNIPLNIFKLTKKQCKYKTRQQHENDINKIAKKIYKITKDNSTIEIVLDRQLGEGHSSRSSEYKNGKYRLNISSLNSIIEINSKEKYVDVESLVTFEDLVNETLKYNLLPCVVPEFKSITIGGAIQGIGIESSSFIYGTFDKTVLNAILITGDGQVINSNDNLRLWNGIPGSNGTIAMIAAARIRLIEATEWIHLKYVYYSEVSNFFQSIERTFSSRNDSTWIGDHQILDGIYFSNKNKNFNGIISMSGGCVKSIQSNRNIYKENYFSPFFYQHVENILFEKKFSNCKNGEIIYEEYISTIDYLFRYDRGGFWGIECLAKMIPLMNFLLNKKSFRLILNYFFQTKILYKIAMLISDKKRESLGMLQDIDISKNYAQNIIQWASEKGLNKIWLCPIRSFQNNESLFNVAKSNEDFIINIGLYGKIEHLPQSNIELQKLVCKFHGKIGLYAHIYLNREEFWDCYDYKEYLYLRKMFHGFVFMDLWEKVAKITFTKGFLK